MEAVSQFCIVTAAGPRCSRRSSDGWLSPGPRAGLSVELVRPSPGHLPPLPPVRLPRFWVPSKGHATHRDRLRARGASQRPMEVWTVTVNAGPTDHSALRRHRRVVMTTCQAPRRNRLHQPAGDQGGRGHRAEPACCELLCAAAGRAGRNRPVGHPRGVAGVSRHLRPLRREMTEMMPGSRCAPRL